MPPKQISELLAKLNDDVELKGKIEKALDYDAVVAIANEAGFDISKADLIRNEATQALELSDEDLEGVSGGSLTVALCIMTAVGTLAFTAGVGGGIVGAFTGNKHKS